jgi:hypothetical protein
VPDDATDGGIWEFCPLVPTIAFPKGVGPALLSNTRSYADEPIPITLTPFCHAEPAPHEPPRLLRRLPPANASEADLERVLDNFKADERFLEPPDELDAKGLVREPLLVVII